MPPCRKPNYPSCPSGDTSAGCAALHGNYGPDRLEFYDSYIMQLVPRRLDKRVFCPQFVCISVHSQLTSSCVVFACNSHPSKRLPRISRILITHHYPAILHRPQWKSFTLEQLHSRQRSGRAGIISAPSIPYLVLFSSAMRHADSLRNGRWSICLTSRCAGQFDRHCVPSSTLQCHSQRLRTIKQGSRASVIDFVRCPHAGHSPSPLSVPGTQN